MRIFFLIIIFGLLISNSCTNTKQLTKEVSITKTEYPKTFEEAEQWFDSIHSNFPLDTVSQINNELFTETMK